MRRNRLTVKDSNEQSVFGFVYSGSVFVLWLESLKGCLVDLYAHASNFGGPLAGLRVVRRFELSIARVE